MNYFEYQADYIALDKVRLPVVELETTITNGATLTDAENAALNEASKDWLPFILKARSDAGAVNLIMFCVSPSEIYKYTYLCDFLGIRFSLSSKNGIWEVSME